MEDVGALVVLGDSLSDTGNAGRFSDGPVWVERLALGLGLPPPRPSRLRGGTNHAVGGARVQGGPSDLRRQAADALLRARRDGGGALDPTDLHLVWGGGNDVLAAALAPDRDAAVRGAAAALGGIVGELAAAGARRLLVLNLPDLGLTPAVRLAGPAWAAEARRLSRLFDDALERALAAAEAGRPAGSLDLRRLDVWAMAERVAADPAASGFEDVDRPCRGLPSCAGFLFWDHLHPTAAAHARLAEAALRVLSARAPGPEPSARAPGPARAIPP